MAQRYYDNGGRRPGKKSYSRQSTDGASTDLYTYTTNTDSTAGAKSENFREWMKYTIFAANIVFFVVGIILLAMGVWLRTDSRFRNFISERYRQAVDSAFWDAPTLYAFSYIIIVMGAVMMIVALLGCCGASEKSRLFLIIYSMVVFLLMIATLSCGIYLIYKKDGIDVELSDALNYMVQHYYMGAGVVQEALDKLQTTFRCCGNAGCSDFRIFRQDIPRSCDIRCDGCHYRIMIALRIGFSVTIIVFSAVVLFQVLAICCSLWFVFTRKKEIRVIYVEARERRAPEGLSRNAIKMHDLPYELRKKRKEYY